MDNWAFIRLMTLGYCATGVALMVVIPVLFRSQFKQNERRDFYILVVLLVPMAMFCLWLLWICMYLAQLNPMITPIRHFHDVAHEAEKVVAAA